MLGVVPGNSGCLINTMGGKEGGREEGRKEGRSEGRKGGRVNGRKKNERVKKGNINLKDIQRPCKLFRTFNIFS